MQLRITISLFISVLVLLSTANSIHAEKKSVNEYGIVILLDKECTIKADSLNNEIANLLPSLPNPHNTWHVTLHHAALSETYINELKNSLSTLRLAPIDLYFDKIQTVDGRWINLNVKKNKDLSHLHNKVVKISEMYFQRALLRAHDVYHTLTDKKKSQVDNYGNYGILEDYRPHMTLFYQYPSDPKLEDAGIKIAKNIKPMKCKAKKLAITEIEYNGNISKIIHSIKFP